MKWLIIIAVIITFLTIILGCSSSGDSSKITVTVRKITLNEISLGMNNIDVAFRVSNENETKTYLDKIEYKIYLGYNDSWIMIDQAEKQSMDINANEMTDFTVATMIEKKHLSKVITDKMLGAEPTKMKIDGFAWFEVGSESFEIQFNHEDDDPYNPLAEDENATTPNPIETGTEEAINE